MVDPRTPIELPEPLEAEYNLWSALLDLAATATVEWTLIGGQMVLLHALASGVAPTRVSTDLDALVNVRAVARATQQFAATLSSLLFHLTDTNAADGIGHRFVRDATRIDVLGPEGAGRHPLFTLHPWRTVAVPGGTQALRRSENVAVRIRDREGVIPRPNLLGAILVKARAVTRDDAPEAQRRDLALLLTLVSDPFAMADDMRGSERGWLRRRDELRDPRHAAWIGLANAADGLAALEILSQAP